MNVSSVIETGLEMKVSSKNSMTMAVSHINRIFNPHIGKSMEQIVVTFCIFSGLGLQVRQ
jgi:hypothetical protein